MWRKALIATVVLVVLMTIIGSVSRFVTVSVVESDHSLWTDLGGTKGMFVVIMIWVGRIVEIALTFTVILWALHTSTPGQRAIYTEQLPE